MLRRVTALPRNVVKPLSLSRRGSSRTTSSPSAKLQGRSIAVVGAGLAGLTLTLHLARHLSPQQGHRIVLYESSKRIGGWVNSDRVQIEGDSLENEKQHTTALIEAGPRSIRPAGLPGLAMLDLIRSLDLSSSLLNVPKSHASAKNRFLYYAGKIHLLPSSIGTALQTLLLDRSHPLSKGKLPSSILRGLFKGKEKRESKDRWADESIESFLRRRLGKSESESLPLLDYVGSAVLHGIYAADASKLSVRSIFGFLYNADLVHGGPSRALLPSFLNSRYTSMEDLAKNDGDEIAKLEIIRAERQDKELESLKMSLGESYVKELEKISVVSFPDGIQTLTDAITKECRERGVSIKVDSQVDSVRLSNDQVEITTADGTQSHDRMISALPSAVLQVVLQGVSLPNLSYNPSSTVAVLNLALPPSSAIQTPPGFGYLVPRACAKEGDNPMGLLGVVFDSVAVPGQDDCSKFTMMFGGPFWKQGFGVHDLLSNNQEAAFIDKALSLVASHLSLDESALKHKSTMKRLTLQRDCIVTYAPGHLGRMDELDRALQNENRLTVVGASYTGVSVNDCVLNATRTAKRVVASELYDGHHLSVTGLEELVRE